MVGHDYRGHGAHCKARCGYVQPGARPAPRPEDSEVPWETAQDDGPSWLRDDPDPYDDPNYYDPCQAAGVHVCSPSHPCDERPAPK